MNANKNEYRFIRTVMENPPFINKLSILCLKYVYLMNIR